MLVLDARRRGGAAACERRRVHRHRRRRHQGRHRGARGRRASTMFDPMPDAHGHQRARWSTRSSRQIERCAARALAVAVGVPSIIEFATGPGPPQVNLPLARRAAARVLSRALRAAGLRRERRVVRRARRGVQVGGQIVCENLVMFTIGTGVGGGLVLGGKLYRGATSAAELGHTIVGLDLTDGAPADPGAFPQPGSLEALASGPRARPARARVGPRAPEVVPRPAARQGRRDHRARRRRGRARGRRALPARDPRARRAARDRDRQRDQHVRSRRGRDRRRRLAGRRPAARARPSAPRAATRCRAPARSTTIRLARHGPQAGVLGAATVAAQEYAAATRGTRRRPVER